MSTVTDHYETLLAEHYSWMFGVTPDVKAAEQLELLTRLRMAPGGLAIDLGAGCGFQSMALADLGFERVLAVDTSARLLQELQSNCGGRPVTAMEDDMLHVMQHAAPGSADAVVCMGDTLTHLPRRDLVPQLFSAVSAVLRPGGRFVLTYRDLSTELRGVDRFIPVRSTADKIMTCFLEYQPGTVVVHDLVHSREDGSWKLARSSYPKLRLPVDEVRHELAQAGLDVYAADNVRGMTVLAAQRL